MKCKKCERVKLIKEYPLFTLNEDCDHQPLHCLRCVTSHYEQTKQCSQCDRPVEATSLNLKKSYSILKSLFPEDQCASAATSIHASEPPTITVKRLNGEVAKVPYNPTFTIHKIKKLVQELLMVSSDKQRLVYASKELRDIKPDKKEATLATYGVQPDSTIHLMVLLYAVPADLNKVVFDLYWGYPTHGRDYLDASALVFSGKSFVEVIDYSKKSKASEAILHSGDLMDDDNKRGHHIIHVELQSMPANVTSVFFTLSAWKSPTISRFKSPSLRFFELSKPEKMLCPDETNKAGYKQAIVMCSLTKRGGNWYVDSNGALSDGNARKYDPLIATVQRLLTTMGG